MKVRRISGVLLAAVTMCGAFAATAQDVVEIRLRGRFYTEHATIRVTIAVEPDKSNRSLIVAADGDRLFRSSEVALEGARAQRLHTVEFKNLPAGQYVLRAEVHSTGDDVRGFAEELLVIGEPGERR